MTTLLIVTGASRGLGRSICLQFAKNLCGSLKFRISASNSSLLETVATEIKDIRRDTTAVECLPADLSNIQVLSEASNVLFAPSDESLSQIIFINNHGSLGELTLIGTQDLMKLQTAINLNVTSCCYLSSEAVKMASLNKTIPFTIVNVSSLCAIQPFQSWGIYCAGKAARDMYHRVLAEEYPNSNIKALNYAPGTCCNCMVCSGVISIVRSS
jgi:sepiapterin reductase